MAKNKLTKAAMGSLVALTAVGGLAGCGSSSKAVQCFGVSNDGSSQPLLMSAGECEKLAGGTAQPATESEQKNYKPYSYDPYIRCYGVAAGGKNDCGTKSSACAGSASKAKRPDAWIAFPEKLCEKVGGKVVKPTKAGYWEKIKNKYP